MNTDVWTLQLGELSVHVVRRRIKHLHIGVYPPDGRVRVAAPMLLSTDAVRLAVIDRLAWIRQHQRVFETQERQSPRTIVTGESHYLFGRRYRLRVVETTGAPRVVLKSRSAIDLFVRPGTPGAKREALLAAWAREHLIAVLAPLVERWQERIGVYAAEWGVKRMKTKWGSFSTSSRRLWFNSELVKHSPVCVEYVVVHELLHLLDPTHGPFFVTLLDCYFPRWRATRSRLNAAPLGHERWASWVTDGAPD